MLFRSYYTVWTDPAAIAEDPPIATTAVVVASSTHGTKTFTGATSFAAAGYGPGDTVVVAHAAGTVNCAFTGTYTVASVAATTLVLAETFSASEGTSGDCLIARTAVVTCGDAGDWSTCSAITGAATCAAATASHCAWDTSVSGYPHCSVRCTQAVSSATSTFGGLTNGVQYRFTITATNDHGTSDHSIWQGNCVDSAGGSQVSYASCPGGVATRTWVPEIGRASCRERV